MAAGENGRMVLVAFHSTCGHARRTADGVAEGAREVPGVKVALQRVPKRLSEQALAVLGALEPRKGLADVPVCATEELAGTRFQGRHGAAIAKRLAG